MNDLSPYYNIDPSTGGVVRFKPGAAKMLDINRSRVFNPNSFYDDMNTASDKVLLATGKSPTVEEILKIMKMQNSTNAVNNPIVMPSYPGSRKNGGNVMKKFVVPFYTGKTTI